MRRATVFDRPLDRALLALRLAGFEHQADPERLDRWLSSCLLCSGQLELLEGTDEALTVRCAGGCDPFAVKVALDSQLPVDGRDVQLVSASTVKPRRVRWLWQQRIPLSGGSIVAGKPGKGKSMVLAGCAAKVTRGELEGDLLGEPRHVVIASAEDDPAAVLVPRLMAADADLSRVHFLRVQTDGDESLLTLPGDVQAIGERVSQVNSALVLIDPIVAYLDSQTDSHRDASTRRTLAPLARMAEVQDVAVVAVLHLNKMPNATDPLDRLGGSVAFGAAARSVLLFGGADLEDQPQERDLVPIKNNYGKLAPALRFRIEAREIADGAGGLIGDVPVCVTLGESDVTADDLLRIDPDGRTQVDEAIAFLDAELSDGPRPVKEIKRAAADAGISDSTLQRAKKKRKVRSDRVGGAASAGHWEWSLAKESTNAPAQDPEPLSALNGSGTLKKPKKTKVGSHGDVDHHGW